MSKGLGPALRPEERPDHCWPHSWSMSGFVYKELLPKGGGGGSGGVPQRGRLFKFDFPSAKFWVKIFFWRVGLRAKRPPPSYKQSLVHVWPGLGAHRPRE